MYLSGEYTEQAHKLCLMGATDVQLADFFDVSERTLDRWKRQHTVFFEITRDGKIFADANIAKSLYECAKGYSHPEGNIFLKDGIVIRVDTVKHYRPDTPACIFWLKNRQPERWRDVREVDNNRA